MIITKGKREREKEKTHKNEEGTILSDEYKTLANILKSINLINYLLKINRKKLPKYYKTCFKRP
ncbi:hypothetical protein BpHYR1_023930 [Brachionus plicatilis]|uniref:Uncharacterized protein n=1 Tax=Brachionus plicatilis TaxID=10195 RepID=A0A3M7S5I8_BRAPC|nr:hypothetical protein BpHYR1_023930 [Brachionus plicatilis]